MKRIIICLLLICIICLGCFALTACDKESNDSLVKLIKNEYKYQHNGLRQYNSYTFLMYYLPAWYRCPDDTSDYYRAGYSYKYQSKDEYQRVCLGVSVTTPTNEWISITLDLMQPEDYIDFIVYYYIFNEAIHEYDWSIKYEYRVDLKNTFKGVLD